MGKSFLLILVFIFPQQVMSYSHSHFSYSFNANSYQVTPYFKKSANTVVMSYAWYVRVKSESWLCSLGDVVRAKMSGHPAWPGILTLCPVSNLWSKVCTITTRFIFRKRSGCAVYDPYHLFDFDPWISDPVSQK